MVAFKDQSDYYWLSLPEFRNFVKIYYMDKKSVRITTPWNLYKYVTNNEKPFKSVMWQGRCA